MRTISDIMRLTQSKKSKTPSRQYKYLYAVSDRVDYMDLMRNKRVVKYKDSVFRTIITQIYVSRGTLARLHDLISSDEDTICAFEVAIRVHPTNLEILHKIYTDAKSYPDIRGKELQVTEYLPLKIILSGINSVRIFVESVTEMDLNDQLSSLYSYVTRETQVWTIMSPSRKFNSYDMILSGFIVDTDIVPLDHVLKPKCLRKHTQTEIIPCSNISRMWRQQISAEPTPKRKVGSLLNHAIT